MANRHPSQLRRSDHIVELPYDILQMIFVACWKDQERKNGSHFPTVASHVCRSWREHALTTPIFWTILEFRQSVPALVKYQAWLERSKDCPLDIVMDSNPFRQASIKHAKEIMRLTVPHIRRWRSISVHDLPNKILRLIFDRMNQEGPALLERLEMLKVVEGKKDAWFYYSLNGRGRNSQGKWTFKPFSKGDLPPQLRHIVLEGVSPHYYLGRFQRLQVLEITNRFVYAEDHGVPYIHNLLSSLPDLHALHVDDSRYRHSSVEVECTQRIRSSQVPPLTHQSLAKFSLHAPQSTRNIIALSIVLPNLRYLLDRGQKEPTLGVCCLPHLSQTQPFPQLVSLRLGGSHSSRTRMNDSWSSSNVNVTNLLHLEGALAGLPELKALTFDHVNFEGGDGQYISCLGRISPRLRWLILIRCAGYTLGDLLSIVENRRKAEGLDSAVRIVVQDWTFPEGTAEEFEGLKNSTSFEFIDLQQYCYADADSLVEREWMKNI